MIKKIAVAAIIILILALSGCVQNAGKTQYFSPKYNGTITLYDDFTMTSISPKASISGTYRIDNDHVILVLAPFGVVMDLTKKGDRLVDEKDGDYWVKI